MNDKVLLLAMKQDPNIYKEFSKNTQTKIRKMMKQPDNQEYTVTRMLLYCLEENYEKLEQELNFYLAEFELKRLKIKEVVGFTFDLFFFFRFFITNNFSVFVPFSCPFLWNLSLFSVR